MNMNNPNRIAHVNTDWTPSVRALICSCSDAGGLLRKLMSTSEIHLANKLIKQRVLYKGISDDKQGTVCYFAHCEYKLTRHNHNTATAQGCEIG